MKIIGSTALKASNFHRQEPKDLDIWITKGFVIFPKTDVYKVTQKLYDLVPTIDNQHATPDAIYTIKCSHFAYDIKWEKTKKDILWLKHKGCKIIPQLYTELKKHWKIQNGNKSHLSLRQKKAEFFDDYVHHKYDHDYLHTLVAFPNPPIYTRCLAQNEEVFIDKNLFFAMPFADQLQMFKEEITVIAIERWVIPRGISWYAAYSLALKKTIISLTKNWATDFIIQNLDYYTKPEYSLFNHILKTLELENKTMNNLKELVLALYKDLDIQESLEEMVFILSEGSAFFTKKNETDYYKNKDHSAKILKEWDYEHISTEGGGEGGSEYCTAIFSLKGQAIKTEYNYYSHHGYDYDDIVYTMKAVTPTVKEVVVYE